MPNIVSRSTLKYGRTNPSPTHIPRPTVVVVPWQITDKKEDPPSRSGFIPPIKIEERLPPTAYERCLAENPGVETVGLCAAAAGKKVKDIAAIYGITPQYTSAIINNRIDRKI